MNRFVEGYLLGGRYRLQSLIAHGGMGDVWRAVDETLGRLVALKVMRLDARAEPVFAQRFADEARTTAGLSHHNIATVYDFGTEEGIAFLVMELIEGQTLSQVISGSGALDPVRVRSIIGQMALALHAAHESGIVHRDVKPGNVLVTADGVIKLTDFGIARATDSAGLTRTGEMLGTPHYLSPEQALGRGATPASDLYALGVVAHELLTGRRPFDRETPVATALAHVTEPMPTLPAAVPSDLIDIVSRCLSKEPEGRPASAQEIALALGVPESEVSIPASTSGSATGGRPIIGKPARFVDLLVGPRARLLVLASGVGRTARDLATLGHRVVGADEDETFIDSVRRDSPEVAWVATSLRDLSLERLGESAVFEVATWLGGTLTAMDPQDRADVLRRVALCLAPKGRLVVEYVEHTAYSYQQFRDDFLSAGFVPDAGFSGWDLRPYTPDSARSIVLLSRR